MAPLIESFPPSQLQDKVQFTANGKKRKPPVNLKDCALKELLQYSCDLDRPKEDPKARVVCEPVLRMFRRCANGLTVETTDWEGVNDR